LPHSIIDTSPANHCYTGGLICNLADPSSPRRPDYLCGEFTWDGGIRYLNWYHEDNGAWTRTRVADGIGIAVGMGCADLTGNGKGDIISAEWRLADRGKEAEEGHIYWWEQPDDPINEPWTRHILATSWEKTHDLFIGDIRGRGRSDVLVRMKDGRMSWFEAPDDPRKPWTETLVVSEQPGDGTALFDLTGSGSLDIVTAPGYYENVNGDGSAWTFRPFTELNDLNVDHETRIAAADLMGDGSACVVLSESELLQNARILLLHSADKGNSWTVHTLIDQDRDLGAIHSLQITDLDGDGRPDIFAAEMELYVKDADFTRRPTWKAFLNRGGLKFEESTVLDANLGAHMGAAGPITSTTHADFVAKNWSANVDNAHDGLNHVVHVSGWTG